MKHTKHKDRKSYKKWALPSIIPKPTLAILKATCSTRQVIYNKRGAFGFAKQIHGV